MRMQGRSSAKPIRPGDPIRADWLNQVAKWIVRSVSINGAQFRHIGGSLVMDIGDRGKGGGRVSQTAMGTITAVTGTSHAAVYDVESYDGSISLSDVTPYRRPIDSGIILTAASVGDYAMMAVDADGAWFLWDTKEVYQSGAC